MIELVLFLDENHCRNPHLRQVIQAAGVRFESFLDHFESGTPDVEWIPQIAAKHWVLLTSDASIRSNELERAAVQDTGLRMFYFSRNNIPGPEMGTAVARALPKLLHIAETVPPPFTASITRKGEVTLRDVFR